MVKVSVGKQGRTGALVLAGSTQHAIPAAIAWSSNTDVFDCESIPRGETNGTIGTRCTMGPAGFSEPVTSSYQMVDMGTAIKTIVDAMQALNAEKCSIAGTDTAQLVGRILAEDVCAPAPVPPFPASIKDGYAIVSSSEYSADKAFELVEQESLAGPRSSGHANNDTQRALSPGQCAYITTGAPMPDGADAVIMVEQSRVKEVSSGENTDSDSARKQVLFAKWVNGPGADVRAVGSDISLGQTLLSAGDVLGPAELGILLGCGVTEVNLLRKPCIGVMSTGNEVISAEQAATSGGVGDSGLIIDSNRPMLLAAIAESLPFCNSKDLGIVPDDYDTLKSSLINATEDCDIVVTSGGVSMGSRDLVKPILEEIATVHFGRVRMKPGKPLTFATLDRRNKCVIAVPGNPVSAFVCFHLAVAAAAKRLAGWPSDHALGSVISVALGHDFKLDKERPEFHRVILKVCVYDACGARRSVLECVLWT